MHITESDWICQVKIGSISREIRLDPTHCQDCPLYTVPCEDVHISCMLLVCSYNPNKYRGMDEEDDDCMEANFDDILREERKRFVRSLLI